MGFPAKAMKNLTKNIVDSPFIHLYNTSCAYRYYWCKGVMVVNRDGMSIVVVGAGDKKPRRKNEQEVYNNGSYLSTQEASALQGARFPQENAYFQWPQGSRSPPCQGPCPSHPLMEWQTK